MNVLEEGGDYKKMNHLYSHVGNNDTFWEIKTTNED